MMSTGSNRLRTDLLLILKITIAWMVHEFKAGMDIGSATIGEIGVMKKEKTILYSVRKNKIEQYD